ncbi:MAG: hypothetical protein U0531_01760 [Dehalococcoidia bacterium]
MGWRGCVGAADFLQSPSPGQAEVVAQQALAIASDPADYGAEDELIIVREEIAAVPRSGAAAIRPATSSPPPPLPQPA